MSAPVWLYAFGSEGGPYKVGISNQPDVRARQIVAYDPGKTLAGPAWQMQRLIPFAAAADAKAAEKGAHRLLAAHRIRAPGRGPRLEWVATDLDTVFRAMQTASETFPKAGPDIIAEATPMAHLGSVSAVEISQIRAARAMLRLTLQDLADASGVSVATIIRAEKSDGPPSMTRGNLILLQRAFEAAGVVFSPDGGVRPRGPDEAGQAQ